MARRLGIEEQQLAPPSFQQVEHGQWSKTYHCDLITPMVGGGTRSWKPDTKNPVRSQSIKGHLRFWWRTMQAHATAAELKAAEDELWGSIKSPSKVDIQIKEVSSPQIVTLCRTEGPKHDRINYAGYPDYVLFPLQGQKDEQGSLIQEFDLITQLSFKMVLGATSLTPAQQSEVENSVKLWILFGGLGARTRRGCGSLYCEAIMDHFQSGQHIRDFLQQFSPNVSAAPGSLNFGTSPYPVLANSHFGYVASTNQNSTQLWQTYLNDYKNIRQGTVGRDPAAAGVPGRSRWPEPDVIRRKTGAFKVHPPRHPDQWCPRAAFGLPIQTKFNTNREPTDPSGEFNLLPDGHERWPSPIILKILRINDTTTAKIWLLLNQAMPAHLVLKSTHYRPARTALGTPFTILPTELPTAFAGKQALAGSPLPTGAGAHPSGTSPYDILVNYLRVPEVP